MNLRQLETFYWAAKLGSFVRAADRLGATQSTVSMRVLELEHHFGASLFDRTQRTARLTAKGRELVAYAEEMLRLSAEMHTRRSDTETLPGIVRLGVAEVISLTWLPVLVKRIHERWPRIRLEIDEALTRDLVSRLEAGTLDLVMAPGRIPGYGRTTLPLGTVEFAWMASPALALPSGVVGPRDLQNLPVIALARESYHHSSIEEWFRIAGATCRRIDTCKSLSVAASLAEAGLGATLLPVKRFAEAIATGRLVIIRTEPALTPVEFTATGALDSVVPAIRAISVLAAEVSDFDKLSVPKS